MAGAQFPRPVEDLANIEFRADVRLFSVMVALNVAGFDYEDADQEWTPHNATANPASSILDIPFNTHHWQNIPLTCQ